MQIICGLYLSVVEGWSIIFSVQSSHEFCVQDAHLLFRFSLLGKYIRILAVCFVHPSYELCAQDVQLRFGFSQNNVQSKLQHFAYDCRAVRVQSELPKTVLPNKLCSSVSNLCLHAITSAQDLGSVEYDLFLVTNKQSRKLGTTRNHVCKTHVRASHTGACYCV